MRFAMLAAFAAVLLRGQVPPGGTGSVSGRFLDAENGQPIPNYSPHGPDSYVQADSEGRFRIDTLGPGQQLVRLSGFPDNVSAWVTVTAGQDTGGLEIRVRRDGQLSGRVMDQNKDAIMGIRVCAMVREYFAGGLYSYPTVCALTDDRGGYLLQGVRAGRALYLLAELRRDDQTAISDAPAKPEWRRPAYQATYYPGSPTLDGASGIRLHSGEQRDHVDIQMRRSAQYCLEAVLLSQGAPASLGFKLTDEATASANMVPGSMSSGPLRAKFGPDGKIRVCDLYPGRFRMAAIGLGNSTTPSAFGVSEVTIDKEDVRGVKVEALPPVRAQGSVAWDAPGVEKPPLSIVSFSPQPVTNDSFPVRATADNAGQFTLQGFAGLDYMLQPLVKLPSSLPNSYLKDVAYGGASVYHRWLRFGGSLTEARLQVTLANDGGFVKIVPAQQGGKISVNTNFLILPADVTTEAVLADSMVTGQDGPSGDYTSNALPPGKYYVLATYDSIDKTPETLAAIMRLRTQATQVDINPGQTASVTVEPRSLFDR